MRNQLDTFIAEKIRFQVEKRQTNLLWKYLESSPIGLLVIMKTHRLIPGIRSQQSIRRNGMCDVRARAADSIRKWWPQRRMYTSLEMEMTADNNG